MLIRKWLLLLALLCLNCAGASAADLTIAVAANFIAPMKDLARSFESSHPYKIHISSASSGKLYAQIKNGAPFDLFFSADSDKPARLVAAGQAIDDTLFTYAIGRLVLWSKNSALTLRDGAILSSDNYRKLAIANPKLAPFGQAALEVIHALELEQHILPRLVRGENVGQAYQFVYSGNAELGFVSLSQTKQADELGAVWVVPQHLYTPIKQDAVLLKQAKNNQAAHAFLVFIRSAAIQNKIREFGYSAVAQ